MRVRNLVKQTVQRCVVDSSGWRSQPKSTRVSLPYLRVLVDEAMPLAIAACDPDRMAGRGRVGLGY